VIKVGDRFKDMKTRKVLVISRINEEGTVILEGENGLGRRLTGRGSLKQTCEKLEDKGNFEVGPSQTSEAKGLRRFMTKNLF
jgi:hypothetical protein